MPHLMRIRRMPGKILAAILMLICSGAMAEAPPAVAPGTPRSTPLQPVAVYDEAGRIVSAFGGAPPTAAYAVQRTTVIGTTGTLISAADTTARRTVTNTSGIACEFVPASGGAYGTGFPLPAGSSFTFDASGRTTAAIYVACASSGGTAAVLSY